MIVEQWADILGYEGYYQVSNKGRIKSISRKVINHKSGSTRHVEEKILHQQTKPNLYNIVKLNKKGTTKTYHVHRLVAECFIDNHDNKKEVNHKNFNKSDNSSENLEWVSPLENTNHSIQAIRKGNIHILMNIKTGIFYIGYKEAAFQLGLSVAGAKKRIQKNKENIIIV